MDKVSIAAEKGQREKFLDAARTTLTDMEVLKSKLNGIEDGTIIRYAAPRIHMEGEYSNKQIEVTAIAHPLGHPISEYRWRLSA